MLVVCSLCTPTARADGRCGLLQAKSTASVVTPCVFAVAVAVADDGGTPAATDAWIAQQVAEANRIFAPFGVGFVVTERSVLPAAHAHLRTRADRDALAAFVRPGVVNWFVVAELLDVDEAGVVRRGVHWHVGSQAGAPHFVVVSRIAGESVLAHELGHFFGNRAHEGGPDNVMSYHRDGSPPRFDDTQGARIQRTARRHLRGKTLALANDTKP